MSPKLGSPVRSISPRLVAPVIPKEDHWNTEKEVPVEDPPQTRYQKKQWDAKSDIAPGVVQLSPFGQKEFFKDFKEEWPSIHHGSSTKKSWTDRGVSPSEFSDDAGAKRMESQCRLLSIETDSKRLGTATTETSPSTGKSSSPASVTHAAEPADTFFEDKWSPPHQSMQRETNKEDIPRGKVRGMANVFGGSPAMRSSTDFESGSVAASSPSPSPATAERSIAAKIGLDVCSTPSDEASKHWEMNQKEIPRGEVRGMANAFVGSPTVGSLTDFESGPVAASSLPPSSATTERSIAEKSGRDDGFQGTTPSSQGSKQREKNKEEIFKDKVRGMTNMFGGSPTKESSIDFESGPVASSFRPLQATTESSNAEKSGPDDGFLGTSSSNEGVDPWILPTTPSNQLFPADAAKWGASVTKYPESNEWESGKDWFQSTSFGNETKSTDGQRTRNDNATENKSQPHDVKAMASEPFSSNVAPTQESSLARSVNPASSQVRDVASLTANLDDETSCQAGAEDEDTMKETKKGKKKRGFFNFFGGVSRFWTRILPCLEMSKLVSSHGVFSLLNWTRTRARTTKLRNPRMRRLAAAGVPQ
jgi:hypothetical protein